MTDRWKTTEYDRACGTDCLTRVQNGKSVFQGVELGAAAHLGNAWSLGGSLMLLDAETPVPGGTPAPGRAGTGNRQDLV